MTRRCYIVTGIVQGVGFRYFTLKRARERGVVGYVQNLPDGRVEIVAEGTDEALESFRGDLTVGPSFARVAAVDEQPPPREGRFQSFSIAR